MMKLRPRPNGRPSMNTEIARARRSRGNRSPSKELAVGAQLASPMPTPTRVTNNDAKSQARPDSAVSRLQTVTPTARSFVRRAENFCSPESPGGPGERFIGLK